MPNLPPQRPAPFQFSLRAMLGILTAMAVLMSLLQWAGAPREVSILVLVILVIGSVAAVGLLLVIAKAAQSDSESPEASKPESKGDG